MKRPARLVIGLTGGIASGKTTVLDEFARLGAATLSLDEIAREQALPGRAGWKNIVAEFGRDALDQKGHIDRPRLAERVFRDPRARRRLEKATHPPILREMHRRIARRRGVVVVDAPLLFEAGLSDRFDATVFVDCPVAVQVRRVSRRDGLSAAAARRRLRAQWPRARKRVLADCALDNAGARAALRGRVRELFAGLKLLYGGTQNGNAD